MVVLPGYYGLSFTLVNGLQLSSSAGYFDLETTSVTQNVQLPPYAYINVTADDISGNQVNGATATVEGGSGSFSLAGVTFGATVNESQTTANGGQASLQVFQDMSFGIGDIAVQYPGNPPLTGYNTTSSKYQQW